MTIPFSEAKERRPVPSGGDQPRAQNLVRCLGILRGLKERGMLSAEAAKWIATVERTLAVLPPS